MTEKLYQLVEESISLELNVADLYMFFFRTFPEDKEFWWQLALEEQNHAALLKGGRDSFMEKDTFPEDILESDVEVLKKANFDLKNKLEQFLSSSPSREEAFKTALQIESSAGEAHFQKKMKGDTDNTYIKIFQQLNRDDIDHAARIRAYMKSNGIEILS